MIYMYIFQVRCTGRAKPYDTADEKRTQNSNGVYVVDRARAPAGITTPKVPKTPRRGEAQVKFETLNTSV